MYHQILAGVTQVIVAGKCECDSLWLVDTNTNACAPGLQIFRIHALYHDRRSILLFLGAFCAVGCAICGVSRAERRAGEPNIVTSVRDLGSGRLRRHGNSALSGTRINGKTFKGLDAIFPCPIHSASVCVKVVSSYVTFIGMDFKGQM